MRLTIIVEAGAPDMALDLAGEWIENARNLTYYPDFPMKAEWHRVNAEDTELRAFVEPTGGGSA